VQLRNVNEEVFVVFKVKELTFVGDIVFPPLPAMAIVEKDDMLVVG
jgi:hypothetical protein